MGTDEPLRRDRGSLEVFERLGPQAAGDLASKVEWIDVEGGRTLFRQGDAADAMYVVAEGSLLARREEPGCAPAVVGKMGPGDLVGEVALLMGGARSATVTAVERSRLARLAAGDVEALLARDPEVRKGLLDIARRRLRRSQWLRILSGYFGEIDPAKYEFIVPRFEWVHLDRGETLFSRGDAAGEMYFLVHGLLEAVPEADEGRPGAGVPISRGEIVGEMAVLSGDTRAATVRAVRDSDLVRLSKADFEAVHGAYPEFGLTVLRLLAGRLRERGRAPRRRNAVNIALVPADPGVPLSEFARRLHAAMSPADRTARLSRRALEVELPGAPGIAEAGDDDPLGLGLLAWLEDLESSRDFVLYEADAGPTPWTKRCLRQADRVLVVARAGGDPAPGPIERGYLPEDAGLPVAPRALVLVHPEGTVLPSGTRAWLEPRRLSGHQHVRWDRDADFARLARVLSGRSVGLVLGGGGARGMAHLGVLRALEARGIPVDMVGGTSIGAIVGGAVAMGLDADHLERLCRETFQERNPFSDVTLPVVSLLRSRKIDRAARQAYGEARIEDLWLSYFCVSSNLGGCDERVHADGPLWAAARTSSSLPGIMVPVVHDGTVHVDGGVMNNLPGDIMRRRAGLVITVDVDSRENMSAAFAEFPSPWRIFWSRALPWKKALRVPNISEIMMATIMTGSRKGADAVKADADLSLEPPVRGIGILDFKAIDETSRAAYEYTMKMIDGLPPDSPLRAFTDQKPRDGDACPA